MNALAASMLEIRCNLSSFAGSPIPSLRSVGMYGLVLRRSVMTFCREIQAALLASGNSGYDGRCDGTIHPSLREEVGMSATPMETQGALSAQLCCAKPRMVVEREIDSEDKR